MHKADKMEASTPCVGLMLSEAQAIDNNKGNPGNRVSRLAHKNKLTSGGQGQLASSDIADDSHLFFAVVPIKQGIDNG